jgi:hypothetical protein
MRKATVHVGELPGEQTFWSFGADIALKSNYDVVVGYKTAEEQAAAVQTFLTAPFDIAKACLRRAVKQEAVIWGSQRRRGQVH